MTNIPRKSRLLGPALIGLVVLWVTAAACSSDSPATSPTNGGKRSGLATRGRTHQTADPNPGVDASNRRRAPDGGAHRDADPRGSCDGGNAGVCCCLIRRCARA